MDRSLGNRHQSGGGKHRDDPYLEAFARCLRRGASRKSRACGERAT